MSNPQEQTLAGKRILVAEDSWHIAFGLKTILEGEQAEVIGPAATLAKAQALCEAEALDLALVDIDLRGEMAYPLLEALARRGVASVILSGHHDLVGVDPAETTVLAKPVAADELIESLRRALASRG